MSWWMKIASGYAVLLDMKKYKMIKILTKARLVSYQGLDKVLNIRPFLFCNVIPKFLIYNLVFPRIDLGSYSIPVFPPFPIILKWKCFFLVFMLCHSIRWVVTIWELCQLGDDAQDMAWPEWVGKGEASLILSNLKMSFRNRKFFLYSFHKSQCFSECLNLLLEAKTVPEQPLPALIPLQWRHSDHTKNSKLSKTPKKIHLQYLSTSKLSLSWRI